MKFTYYDYEDLVPINLTNVPKLTFGFEGAELARGLCFPKLTPRFPFPENFIYFQRVWCSAAGTLFSLNIVFSSSLSRLLILLISGSWQLSRLLGQTSSFLLLEELKLYNHPTSCFSLQTMAERRSVESMSSFENIWDGKRHNSQIWIMDDIP